MDPEIFHVVENRLNRKHNVLLLLLPAVIFAVVLAVLFSKYHKYQKVATVYESNVLGEETRLDNEASTEGEYR